MTSPRGETYVIGRDKPGHLGSGGELAVDEDFDLAFAPSVVNVHNCHHVPLGTKKVHVRKMTTWCIGLFVIFGVYLLVIPNHLHYTYWPHLLQHNYSRFNLCM